MDILRKEWNGIEYYLIDKYETEFSFGIVYHFVSDNDEKFCFYRDNTYIPIKNKIHLRKIAKELKISSDILFRSNPIKQLSNIKKKSISSNRGRWDAEKEYQAYDEVSKIIHELFPDIPYNDTMKILDDDSGIYSAFLQDDVGCYYHKTKEIHLHMLTKNTEEKKRTILHEAIHKLTDRNGFLQYNNKYFVGLIEGSTEKICEDKYGDKTSHTEYLDDKAIYMNFSCDAAYSLPQIVYRQMAQLVPPKISDRSIINGNTNFFDKFSDLYGKDLFLYLNHRTNRFLKKSLSEKRKLKYLKEAQTMLLTKAFDKKFSAIQSEEDIINYMTELRNFEYVTAQIEDDTTFQDYYNSKYNAIHHLAWLKGMDLSKVEQFQYSEVDFYPKRNSERVRPFEITSAHIYNLLDIKEIDLSKCTRIQVEPSPGFFNLDIILQNNVPISAVECNYPFPINSIEHDDEYFNFLKEDFDIKEDEIDIYNIAPDTYMMIEPDGTSAIYYKSYITEKIYNLSKNDVDLEITSEDIEEKKREFETSMSDTFDFEEIPIGIDNIGDKKGITSLFYKFKNFFMNSFINKKPRLPASTANLPTDMSTSSPSNATKTKHSAFVSQLNPNDPIYDHSTIVPVRKSEPSNENTIDVEEEIDA